MITTHDIGMMSLNISFVLYLVVFLPQILHNRDKNHIAHLSISMHYVLYFGILFDLLYGFAGGFQWQYKTVSIACLSVMSIQHLQITRHFFITHQVKRTIINILALIVTATCIFYFFTSMGHTLTDARTLFVGYASRACYLLYTLPQIIKNTKLKQAHAISLHFILLNITLLILDTISAWCLDWGWPNKLSAPISLIFMLILLFQKMSQMMPMRPFGRIVQINVE